MEKLSCKHFRFNSTQVVNGGKAVTTFEYVGLQCDDRLGLSMKVIPTVVLKETHKHRDLA